MCPSKFSICCPTTFCLSFCSRLQRHKPFQINPTEESSGMPSKWSTQNLSEAISTKKMSTYAVFNRTFCDSLELLEHASIIELNNNGQPSLNRLGIMEQVPHSRNCNVIQALVKNITGKRGELVHSAWKYYCWYSRAVNNLKSVSCSNLGNQMIPAVVRMFELKDKLDTWGFFQREVKTVYQPV